MCVVGMLLDKEGRKSGPARPRAATFVLWVVGSRGKERWKLMKNG